MIHLRSTFAVASSMTRILLFLNIALARHTSCFCPMLKLLPASVISASRPPGMHPTALDSWTSCRAVHSWSSENSENGSRLYLTVPLNRTGSCKEEVKMYTMNLNERENIKSIFVADNSTCRLKVHGLFYHITARHHNQITTREMNS